MEEATETSSGYGKRPMWQWVAIYVVVGGVIYGLLYYFVLSKKGGYTAVTTPAPVTEVTNTTAPAAALVMTKTDPKKGDYLTDPAGMTLYIFDKDTPGVSTCTGACATTWPPYVAASGSAQLPADFTVIKRSDNAMQYAWKGWPLYYYAKDKQVGDVLGDGVGGTWHLIK